jgi:hypothetical protein
LSNYILNNYALTPNTEARVSPISAGDFATLMPAASSAHHRLFHVLLDEIRRQLFGVATDFADHDDRFRLRVAIEEIERVGEGCSDNGIAADADGRRLANAALG